MSKASQITTTVPHRYRMTFCLENLSCLTIRLSFFSLRRCVDHLCLLYTSSSFAGTSGHQLIELCVFRKTVDKGNECRTILDKARSCIGICDIAELLIGDIQEPCQLLTVRSSLIQHNNKLRVRKHRTRLNRIQQVFYILCDRRRIGVSLSELTPSRVEERRGRCV